MLIAHLIPFRSRNLESLHRRDESIAFGRRLWSDILAAWTPRVIMTIGKEVFDNLRFILNTRLHAGNTERFPTGHGNRAARTAEACRFWVPGRETSLTLARLPHLSRFPLFSIEACRQPVEQFLNYVYGPDSRTGLIGTTTLGTPSEDRPQRRQRSVVQRISGEADAGTRLGAPPDSHPSMRTRLHELDGAELYLEWEAHIADQQVRAAFRLLVDLAAASPRLVLSFRRKGVLKTCCLHDRSGGRRSLPYAFIVNKGWLKFYFRLPEVRHGQDRLRKDFDSLESNSAGEWTVKVRTENDVRLLLKHVDQLGGDPTPLRHLQGR